METNYDFRNKVGMFTHDEIKAELLRQLDAGILTAAAVARHIGVQGPRITEIRQGKRRIQPREMPILVNLLKMEGRSEVPVVGCVGAGGEIVFEDAYHRGEGMYDVHPMPGMDTNGLIGLEVRGDSMWPVFRDGYIVFIKRDGWDRVEDDALTDWAVCRIDDGRTLLKEIRQSHVPGHYDLTSQNAPPIENVKLIWATPVQGHRKRR